MKANTTYPHINTKYNRMKVSVGVECRESREKKQSWKKRREKRIEVKRSKKENSERDSACERRCTWSVVSAGGVRTVWATVGWARRRSRGTRFAGAPVRRSASSTTVRAPRACPPPASICTFALPYSGGSMATGFK